MEAGGRVAAKSALPSCALSIVLLVGFVRTASMTFAAEPPRRILMLHAFNYTFPGTTQISEGARKRLLERSPHKIEVDADFLDLVRVTEAGHEALTAAFLAKKYSRTPPDVVMTLGSAALPFVLKHRAEIAPNVPVVFTSISPQTYAALKPPSDVTGIITEFNLDKTLSLAERLQPDATRLFVIAGSGATDRRWYPVAKKVTESRDRKFETTFLFDLPYENLVAALKAAPPDSIVILLTVFADSEGKTFVPAEVASNLAAISPAPIYAPYDTFIGNGVVGGFVETFESVGVAAADLALEIIAGKGAATPPPRINPEQSYRVDHRALQRWGLLGRNLPPDTTVLFKEPTIWDRHRTIALVALSVLALQSIILGALLIQRRMRRRAETQLQESEERMKYAAVSANIGLWQLDLTTDKLWATEHCRAMFGIADGAQLTLNTLLEGIHPDDRDVASSSIRNALEAGEPVTSDLRVVMPGGQERWVRLRTRPYPEGTSNQLGGIFVDITGQKTAESEAALQRQEVEHLMRVSVLGGLSGSIAHEINQPLTAILSNAQAALHLLKDKSPDLAEIRDALQDIVDEDNRAGEVILRLRNLLKKGERSAESLDVNALVDSTLALLNSELISRGIKVKVEQAHDLPTTHGDRVQLQQVLLNLAMNAMDAMANTPAIHRSLVISTQLTETDMIEVLVRDRGPGIHSSEESRLFEPFYTTKDHGLGLGLPICLTIVQAHGGTLRLSNNESGGAIAALLLPVQEMMIAAQ